MTWQIDSIVVTRNNEIRDMIRDFNLIVMPVYDDIFCLIGDPDHLIVAVGVERAAWCTHSCHTGERSSRHSRNMHAAWHSLTEEHIRVHVQIELKIDLLNLNNV